MKNKPNPDILFPQNVRKIFLTMKISLFLILVSAISLQASSVFSQNKKMTVDMQNVTVREVINEIEKQGGISFLFNDNLHGLNRHVSVVHVDQPVQNVLYSALDQANMTYEEVGENFLVLLPKPEYLKQQDITVTGQVTDAATGEPLPGASVVIQGTTVGVVTNLEGHYKIDVPDQDAVLVFTFVGYIRQVIPIDGRSVVDVILSEDFVALDEVVVVGYGTQRVGTITGSVSRVETEDLSRVSTPSTIQSLQGQTAGLFIKNVAAEPGENKVNMSIRGFGEPLIILDGMPTTMQYFQDMDPNDIDAINILKDAASAAVYGARAGNGVIIITTKRGRISEPQFSFRSDNAWQFVLPNALPTVLSSHEWMELRNFADQNEGRGLTYPRELIELYRQHADGSEPELYPNVNMYDEVIRDYAPMHTNMLSVRGGSENISYFLSGSWLHQRDVMVTDATRYNRYSLRSNTDAKLTDKLSVTLDISLQNRDYYSARSTLEGLGTWWDGQSVMLRLKRWRPFYSIEPLPDPSYPRGAPGGQTINPLNIIDPEQAGYNSYNVLHTDTKLGFNYELPFGFSTRYLFNYSRNDRRDKGYSKLGPEYRYDKANDRYVHVRNNNSWEAVRMSDAQSDFINMQWFLNYDQVFAENHLLQGLFVAEYLSDTYDAFQAWRLDYDFEMDQLFAGPEGSQYNNSSARQGGRVGYIGRLVYNYAGKYTLEGSVRYDGSPKFPEDTRWGLFPSVSTSWLISEEPFMASLDFINSLKLRASYGRLGYDAAGDWQYMATYRFASPYIYRGTDLTRGIRTDAIPNPYITWEEMDLANIGMDFIILNGTFDATFEVYQRDRRNVLGTRIREIPDIVGATMPQENYREFQNRGVDFSFNYNNRGAGSVNYRIGTNISWNREIVKVTDEPEWASMELWRQGSRIGRTSDRILKYPTDGLFRTQEEIDNWADIDGRNNATLQPGDIKWVDTNGDGRITSEDRILVGTGYTPRITGGINAYASFKGFEFFMSWQGAAIYGYDLGNSEYGRPFCCDGNPLRHNYYDSYVPEGNEWMQANTNAYWPRMRVNPRGPSYSNQLEFWWINGRYIRLRQLQLSYTLPQRITNPLGISSLKIIASGYNLLTFSELDFIDPEIDTHPKQYTGLTHPQMGSYNFGIELNF